MRLSWRKASTYPSTLSVNSTMQLFIINGDCKNTYFININLINPLDNCLTYNYQQGQLPPFPGTFSHRKLPQGQLTPKISFLFKKSYFMENVMFLHENRNSRSQMFFKIDVLKNFANFTWKHLCWSFFLKRQNRSVKVKKWLRRLFILPVKCSSVFKYGRVGIIVCCTLRTFPLVEYFLPLNKLYETVFMDLLSTKTYILPFSLAIRATSTMLGENILIL